MSDPAATVGEAAIRRLEAHGVDTVFGIPGVHTLAYYRGLAASAIRHVTPRHEQGAGFMADGFARASGRPAACFIITGPGMTNIATALGQAYGDSVPLLVISSVNNSHELGLGEGRLHELPVLKELVAYLVIERLYKEMSAMPDSRTAGGRREIRMILAIDEAHNYLPHNNLFLQRIVREGRSKGVAVFFVSQSPADYEQKSFDFKEHLEFSLIHIYLLISSYGVHSTNNFPLACFIVPAHKLIANNVATGHHDSIYLFLLRKDDCIYTFFGTRDSPGL